LQDGHGELAGEEVLVKVPMFVVSADVATGDELTDKYGGRWRGERLVVV
jgi:hypothetical protein